MSTVLRRVFANPQVTPGLLIALLAVGTYAWFAWGKALVADLRNDWQIDRAMHWTPEPWALTADEFPGHDAVELTVDRAFVSRWHKPDWALEASMVPGLDLLFYTTGPVGTEGDWRDDGTFSYDRRTTDAVAGTRVDGVDVLTYVSAPEGPSYATPQGAALPWALRDTALDAPVRLLDTEYPVYADPFADETLLSVAYVGHRPSEQERFEDRAEAFDAGGPGYFGLVAHHRDAAGVERTTTTVAAVVEGALVVVGVVVPDGAEPSPDLEPALLLERLSAEVRADPPSYPEPERGELLVAQADSRTTREVGSVIAAGS
ncbi:hypothetical protein AAG589_17430 [Isoptericola sp. F-RaC21]|uniref:hypothetical protein n=1 Tax=Isoptericola sp. F-RaC21 TaxID=3141452 RepID=UPI00315BC417